METRTKINLAMNTYFVESQPENPFKSLDSMLSHYRKKEEGAFLANFENDLQSENELSIKWAMEKLAQDNPMGEVATPESFRDAFIPLKRSGFEFEEIDVKRSIASNWSLVNFDIKAEALVVIGAILLIWFGRK